MNEVRFNKFLLLVNGLVPLVLLGIDALLGRLGANPIEFFLRTTGVMTLIFILVTLAVTPLRRFFGWNGLIKYRRMIGLFAFFYGFIHLLTYGAFDRSLSAYEIIVDIAQRPFIAVGMAAFLILIPLAITSTNGWVKRLGGRNWGRLHKLTYAAAILGVIHFWMIVKSDVFYPALFGAALTLLLGYRLFPARTKPLISRKS